MNISSTNDYVFKGENYMTNYNNSTWGRNTSDSTSREFEDFIERLMIVWDDNPKVDKSKGMGPIIKNVILDIESRTNLISSKYMTELDSYQKMEKFIEDIDEKVRRGEDCYGATYHMLRKNDFGYNVAYDIITPKPDSLEPIRPNYNMQVLPFDKVICFNGGKAVVRNYKGF